MHKALLGIVVGGALVAVAASASAESRCTALKYRLAAKAAFAKARCTALAVKRGGEVNPLCIAKAQATLARKWADAESKGDCLSTDDLAAAEGAIDAFLAALTDALEPPAITAVCCEGGGACWHGAGFPDEASCVQFGASAGPPGTVCDGATGTCQPPPAGTGQCCFLPSFSVCSGGPSLNLAGCVSSGGLDFPFGAICAPNGACTLAGP